jgi:nucleotide-binding universal stress UspA family protein
VIVMNHPAPIVVAVGMTDADAALQYAAHEAIRMDAPLHLVHVLQIPASDASAAGVYQGVLKESDVIMDTAAERARALTHGRVSVTSERFDQSPPTTSLVKSADRASQIVLQHRHLSAGRRFFTSSTVSGVAARAHVPVVVVPAGWQPAKSPQPVTAGVQDPLEAAAVLRPAYAEARLRGTGLVILHAWWLNSGYDVVAVDDDYRQQRAAEFEGLLAPVIAAMSGEWPDVHATVEVLHAPSAVALLDRAERSDLLVIGRRHHHLPLGSHLGPVARAVLHHSSCPVLVAPEAPVEVSEEVSEEATATHAVRRRYQPGVMY